MPAPRWLARFNRRVTNRIARTHAGWMPGMAIVHHVGRRSGTPYNTPVLLFHDDRDFVIELTYGADSDWVHNVIAADECDLITRGETLHCTDPRIEPADNHRWAPGIARIVLDLLKVDRIMRLTCKDKPS